MKYANAKATCDKAVSVHVWCTLVTFPGTGHTVGAYQPDLLKSMTATYFADHLATAPGASSGRLWPAPGTTVSDPLRSRGSSRRASDKNFSSSAPTNSCTGTGSAPSHRP